MSQGLSKGERPSWASPGRGGASAMERVADSASARRAKQGRRRAASRKAPPRR